MDTLTSAPRLHHLMLAKFKPEITHEQIAAMIPDIAAIYEHARELPGVYDVIIRENCVARPNRFDLSVTLVMEPSSLPLWDAFEWHAAWKSRYGHLLEAKSIFDYLE